MKKLISLIIPPSVFLLDERVFVNLGILKVASSLECAGYPVEIIDLSGIKNYRDALKTYLQSTKSTIFGITTTTPQFPSTIQIAIEIKKIKPNAKLIVGGPHPTLVYSAYLREKRLNQFARADRSLKQLLEHFNVLVAGDGEEAIFQAIHSNERIINADDVNSSLFLNQKRLNELPFPARHLVDLRSYRFTIGGTPATSLIAQLGCPFACGFCSGRTSPMLRRIRLRSTENVTAEMKSLYELYGYRAFMFYDDELNVNPRMLELMEAIYQLQKTLGVKFKLRGCIKAQLFTDEQARAMRKAGFSTLLVGFESGSERILTNINKKASKADNTRCVAICKRHGIKVKALMSIGHPGESMDTIYETRDWLLEAQPDEFNLTIITCTPGTFYYDHAIKNTKYENVWTYTFPLTGDKLHSIDVDYSVISDYYNGDPKAGYRSFVFTDFVNEENLVSLREEVDYEVRQKLGIPFYSNAASVRFDQSMGQIGHIPDYILYSNKHSINFKN